MMTMKTSSVNSSTMRINANFARIALGLCLLLLATLTTISIEIDFDWWSTTNSQSNRRHRPLFEAYVQCSLASIWLLLQTLRSSYRRHCWRILCSGWDSFPPDGYAPLNQSEIKSTDSPDCNNDAISPLIGLSSVTSLRSNRTLKPALKVGFGVNPSIEVPDSTTKAISHDSEASEIDECKSPNPEPSPFLTDSIWIPLNPSPVTIEERFSSTGGGGDLLRSNPNRYSQHHDELTDDLNISNCDSDNTQKRVRFSKLTEVRFLTCDWSKSASFFLFAPSNWALTSSLTDSNTIDLTANQIDLSPSISLPITPATSSVPFVNAIRKSINCCLLWFLFCYCVLLLRPDHQTLFTLYVFLAYLLLFMLFFQMLIFDSSPPVERISLYKIILFALAMLSVHFLFVSTQPIDSNVPLTSDTTTVGPTKMHNEILDSSERSRIESPLLPAAESWLAVDEEHVHGLHAMQHAGEQPLHKDSSKSEQMTVQTQSTKFDYKHMLLIILTAFCGSFYLCNLRRSNDSNEIFCVFTFVGK